MNIELTDKQLHVLFHALGLSQSGREYRNYFNPGAKDLAVCGGLELLGLMYSRVLCPSDRIYHVTDEGRRIAQLNYDKQKRL